jgi:two-component system, sensor histidine kinase and response regulator
MKAGPIDQPKPAHVLIVEDDAAQLEILRAGLDSAGFLVDTVGSGLDAVWRVGSGRYDAVLVDYRLPEIDGLAAARLIGDLMGQTARPVLIALTASSRHVNAREAVGGNAFDVVVDKSSDFSSIVAVIRQHLASAPDGVARRAAELGLLERGWREYDAEPSRPGGQGDDPGPARILVVEDNEGQRLLLTAVLEKRGYVTEAACNGLEATRKVREGCYDLALLDYNMPEIDGLAVAKIVHNLMDQAARPRLIALTATPARLNAADMHADIIFDDIVEKSADLYGLLCLVDRHLRASPNPIARRAAEFAPPMEPAA